MALGPDANRQKLTQQSIYVVALRKKQRAYLFGASLFTSLKHTWPLNLFSKIPFRLPSHTNSSTYMAPESFFKLPRGMALGPDANRQKLTQQSSIYLRFVTLRKKQRVYLFGGFTV